jgi:hypothetical protein
MPSREADLKVPSQRSRRADWSAAKPAATVKSEFSFSVFVLPCPGAARGEPELRRHIAKSLPEVTEGRRFAMWKRSRATE